MNERTMDHVSGERELPGGRVQCIRVRSGPRPLQWRFRPSAASVISNPLRLRKAKT